MTTKITFFMDGQFQQTTPERLYPYAQYAIAYTDGKKITSLDEQLESRHLAHHIERMREKNGERLTSIVVPQQWVNKYRDTQEAAHIQLNWRLA